MEMEEPAELAIQAGAQMNRRFWKLLELMESKGLLSTDEVNQILDDPTVP